MLFAEAKRCGVRKLILTEINHVASYVEMLRLCRENAPGEDGKSINGDEGYILEVGVGIEFRQGSELFYVGIARNNSGFEELNRFLSFHNSNGRSLPPRAPEFVDVYVIYPFRKQDPASLRSFEFIGVDTKHVSQLRAYTLRGDALDKFVILHPVAFTSKIDFNVHRLLRAIDKNTLLSKLAPSEQADANDVMMPLAELEKFFGDYPSVVANTKRIVEECTLDVSLGEDKNRKQITGSEESDWEYLVAKAWEGFSNRYAASSPEFRKRVEKELSVIKKKGFVAYYLIAFELIQFAKRKGFDFVGRGSGANSIVAYCLGITNVDPIELNLYFERFLNEERSSPPDFDIDFSWDNRDEVYTYLFERYGRDHVCLLGTHVTFQGRSVLRELGKVFGLPKDEIEAVIENPSGLRNRDEITELMFRYAKRITDLPSNFSIHAGGVLITEKPIYSYTATEFPPKSFPVSQLDMHGAEDLGIYKFDILSQRGLGHLKEAVSIIRQNRGEEVDIHRFAEFKEDPKIRQLLRTGKTMGCFYVESPAMRMLLTKLRCEDYLTLVAASSIIRPGVASSGMMRAYIERFHAKANGKSYESIHPKMDELMAETFGVMVYQEDVIKVAHEFAGLTLTEADVLRRGMSGKYRSRHEFQLVKQRFFDNCKQRGYADSVTERVWFEIESFSGYSFAKGHSASYAVESYQSLFLKAHYPLEFMVAVINNFGGFYKTEFYFHEARMLGGILEQPCINRSDYNTNIKGSRIYVGLIHVKGLETKLAHTIIEERKRLGEFRDVQDLLIRVPLALEQLRILIRIGALRFTGKDKQTLLWESMLYFSNKKTNQGRGLLFDVAPKELPLPKLERKPIEDAFDELELLGFPLCDPFMLLSSDERGNCIAKELLSRIGRDVHIVGYLVTVKDTRTKSKQSMNFGTFNDFHGDVFDTVHFPDVAKRYPFRGRGFYSIKGKVTEDFGVPVIEVAWMEKLPMVNKRAEQFMTESTLD